MTIKEILKFALTKLNNIPNPHFEAEFLLSYILKKPREFLLTHNEYKLTKSQIAKYQSLINRRIKGEPIAYLTGHKEFYGLDFFVNKNVLVPRPETELMIDEAMKLITCDTKYTTFIDIGTGSGCIIITLAKLLINHQLRIMNYELSQKLGFYEPEAELLEPTTNYEFIGIDISKSALSIARKNAKFHNINKNIEFLHGNLLEPIINNTKYKIQNTKYILLANLPYGWDAWKNNSSADTIGLKFEPQIALYTGKNGLELYEQFFKQIKTNSYNLKANSSILCEIDPRQTVLIKKLIKKYLPQAKLQIKKDLANFDRLAIITNLLDKKKER